MFWKSIAIDSLAKYPVLLKNVQFYKIVEKGDHAEVWLYHQNRQKPFGLRFTQTDSGVIVQFLPVRSLNLPVTPLTVQI